MSDQTVDRLKTFRGENTVRWLVSKSENEVIDYMMKHHGVLPTFDQTASIEDLERKEVDDSPVYDPLAAMAAEPATGEIVNADRVKPPAAHRLVALVEALFAGFVAGAQQFNSANTNLKVSVYLPEYKFKEMTSDTYTPEAIVEIANGHISTVRWGFLAQVHGTTLGAYAVVPEQLLNFTLHDIRTSGYVPFVTLEAVEAGGQLFWRRNNQVVDADKLNSLARQMVADLVALSEGKLQPEDLSKRY